MRKKSKTEQIENNEFIRRGEKQQKTRMDREAELDNLRNYLLRNGVDAFWANSAIGWVRQAMAGNIHWATDLRQPKVKVDKTYKCVDTLTIKCTLHSVSETVAGQIRYEHKNGHKVSVKAI